jgi:hypothetical protein
MEANASILTIFALERNNRVEQTPLRAIAFRDVCSSFLLLTDKQFTYGNKMI